MATNHRTFADALADPNSSISQFVARSTQAMTHNPRNAQEWADYMTWQRQQAENGADDFTTEAWRAQRG